MLIYFSRRVLQTIPVVIGVTFIIFALIFVLPGDPVRMLIQKGASPEVIQNIQEKYGLDQPWYVQYGRYIGKVIRGDFGNSIRYGRPVTEILGEHYPNSIRLALAALFIELTLGILAGIISAIRRTSFLDTLVTISTAFLLALPAFWLGMLLQSLFGLKFRLLPISGMGDGSWQYYVLPAITLAAVSTGYVARLTRSSMLEVLRENYIRTARAKGLPPRKIIFKHALKNALIPVVTFAGLDLGVLIGSAILTETVFSWPGVGQVIYLAVLQRDYPVILGGTLILVLIFMAINLVVDMGYAYLDPRIRYGRRR